MSILRFRITFEDYDDIHRDIDIRADQYFSDLFQILLSSVNFDQKHTGQFFLADYKWRKGNLLGDVNLSSAKPLNKTALIQYIDDPHQKFLFTYDEQTGWNFMIELTRISPSAQIDTVYPRIIASSGEAPIQYKENLFIPSKEETETENRGRKPAIRKEKDKGIQFQEDMIDGDDIPRQAEPARETHIEELGMDLPEDLELETDNEIAKLAEEFNNTTEISDDVESQDDEEFGFGDDDDDENNRDNEEDEGYGGYGRGRDDFDD